MRYQYLYIDEDTDTLADALAAFPTLCPTLNFEPTHLLVLRAKTSPPDFYLNAGLAPLLRTDFDFKEPPPDQRQTIPGGYATVHVTYVRDPSIATAHRYAKKVINLAPAKDCPQSLREAKIMISVVHPCLTALKFLTFGRDKKPALITDFYPCTSLARTLASGTRFNDTQKMILMYGIAAAGRYLHRRRIAHRDLKSANVLIDQTDSGEFRAVLCDFGLSKDLAETVSRSRAGDERYWNAPEIEADWCSWPAADAYALGLLIALILQGRQSTDAKLAVEGLPGPFADVVLKLTAADPDARPTFANVAAAIENGALFLSGADRDALEKYIREIRAAEDAEEKLEYAIRVGGEKCAGRITGKATGRDLRERHFRALSVSQVSLRIGPSEWPLGARIAHWPKECEKRIEIAPLVAKLVCGGVEIPVVTESVTFGELRERLFPGSMRVEFRQSGRRIEPSVWLHAANMDAPITVVATRVFRIARRGIVAMPFSQWERVRELRRAVADWCSKKEESVFLAQCEDGNIVRVFGNRTRLWELPDEITVVERDGPSAAVYIDGRLVWVLAERSVGETKIEYKLAWIKGNGVILNDAIILQGVVHEMELTAVRDVGRITVRAPSGFAAEIAAVGSDPRMILASYYLRVPLKSIVLHRVRDSEFVVQEESVNLSVCGFCREIDVTVGRFSAVRLVVEEAERQFGIQNVVLTFHGLVLEPDTLLSVAGIGAGARLYAIINPETPPKSPCEVVPVANAAKPEGRRIPFVFITPDGRPVRWHFDPNITLEAARDELGTVLGRRPVAFKRVQGQSRVVLKEIPLTTALETLRGSLIYSCFKYQDPCPAVASWDLFP
jgi:hypothetical protein